MVGFLLRASFILGLLFCATGDAFGQSHYYNVWYFGDGLGLDFRNGSPVPTTSAMLALEGSSVVCDPATGALLFYTNGSTVWNRNHQIMRNGENLFGNLSCTQSALIVPHPGDSLQYYIFTLDGDTYGGPRDPSGLGLNYSVVDLRGDGGMGDVVQRNVSLLRSASEKLTAVRHANGCEFWIVTHELNNDRFYAWYLSKAGLTGAPVVSSAGTSYARTLEAGYLKASPDGTMLFAARSTLGYNRLWGELLQFNSSTGIVGPILAQLPAGYGATFSPDNHFLYASRQDTLLQYNLQADPADIVSSRKVLNRPDGTRFFYAMQIGPDCKVYVVDAPPIPGFVLSSPHIGVINNPNEEGVAADYRLLGFQTFLDETTFYAGLPNCVDGFFVKPQPKTYVICPGDSVRPEASEGNAWKWTPSSGLSCDDCPNPTASPTTSTSYVIRSSSSGACLRFDSVIVTVLDAPRANAGNDTVICPGQSVELQATGGVAYKWEAEKTLSCLDCSDPVAGPEFTTEYVVEVTGENGCTARDTVVVSVNREKAKIVVSDSGICRGESLTLVATGGIEFLWSPSDGLSCTECDTVTAMPERTTTYILRATTNGNCPSFDTVTVLVYDLPVAEAGPDTALCPGESVRLHGAGGTAYQWYPISSLDCEGCPDPVASPIATTTYYLRAMNEEGCESLDSITVRVLDSTDVKVSADTALCPGSSVQLSATGAVSYRWSPAAGLSCIDCPDPVATPKETTRYYVIGTNSTGRCSSVDSVLVTVYPAMTISAGAKRGICAGNATQLHAEGGVRWLWEPADDLSCADCSDPVASPTTTRLYRLTGWNGNGCEARDSVLVVVQEEPQVVHLRIGRGYRGYPDQRVSIPVEVVDLSGITDLSDLTFDMDYDPGVMLVEPTSIEPSLVGTLLEGWSVEIVQSVPGHLILHCVAPPGKGLSRESSSATTILFRFDARLYLSSVRGTDLTFSMEELSNCFSFETAAGYAQLDSLCGLNFRLIEMSGNKYVAPVPYPNPAQERVTLEFGVGLAGPAQLEIFDIRGNRVARIVDGELEPGVYSVEWDVRDIASGIYWCRMTSGDWSGGVEVRVRR